MAFSIPEKGPGFLTPKDMFAIGPFLGSYSGMGGVIHERHGAIACRERHGAIACRDSVWRNGGPKPNYEVRKVLQNESRARA